AGGVRGGGESARYGDTRADAHASHWNEGEGEGEGEGEHAASAWTRNFGEAVGWWLPDYAEVREDRVNVYGLADASAREFVYKVKATAAGSFAVPPAHGEGMYDRAVRAWSQPGRIVVRRPK